MGFGWQHVAGSFGAGALVSVGLCAAPARRSAQTTAAGALEARAAAGAGAGASTELVRQFLLRVAPRLDGSAHKGQAGRVGVLGGSRDYTGAPYYSGQAALSVGADLLYLFTAEEACNPIKSYSPELMVRDTSLVCDSSAHTSFLSPARPLVSAHCLPAVADRAGDGGAAAAWQVTPVYSAQWPEGAEAGVEAMASLVVSMLPRLHSLVIGPGLGRDEAVLEAVAQVILAARARDLPLVIDADGLWLVTERPELVRDCKTVILTPNGTLNVATPPRVIPQSETLTVARGAAQ